MKTLSKIALAGLLALTVIVLAINFKYLYTAPVANTWVYWRGDETWLMSQYKNFLSTGHYTNPLAPGSEYSRCSGLLFGSCYLTATLYGLFSLIIKGHTIDAGRTVTFIFAILTLVASWMIAKRYRVSTVLRAFGCLLLASTLCFFITSHSARSDLLVGLTILMFTGCLPLLIEKQHISRSVLLGLLIPICLLVNGHVLIISLLMFCYLVLISGRFEGWRSVFRRLGLIAATAAGGFVCLLIVQYILLHSTSVLGPLAGGPGEMPFLHFLHPKSDRFDFISRLSIANSSAPGVLWISIVLAAVIIWARIRYRISLFQMGSEESRFVISAALLVLSSICFEIYQTRYFIFVLPTIVLSFIIVTSYLMRTLPRSSRTFLVSALGVCICFALWRYGVETSKMGVADEAITAANKAVITEALSMIHSRHSGRPRIFSTTIGQAIAMDDSCDLLTEVMYIQPKNNPTPRSVLWNQAKIDYAIVCNNARAGDWNETDASIDSLARSRARIIFERTGVFTDVGRIFDQPDVKMPDTLVVYEFKRQ